MRFLAILLLSISASLVSGHARIKSPKPLDAPPEDPTGNAYNAPLAPDGSQFPCKQLHKKAGVDMTPTETWAAGSTASFEILGHITSGEGALAAHSGGSCQASISYNNGTTWSVLKSFHGGCPRDVPLNSNLAGPDQVFQFPIPAEAKAGDALFAWTWTAVTGNRDEFYMNCASVKITGSGTSTLDEYPAMFVGDMNIPGQIATGECRSTAGNALLYPNPGTEVAEAKVAGIPFKGPSAGNCFAPGSAGGSPGPSSSASVQPTATATSGFGKTSVVPTTGGAGKTSVVRTSTAASGETSAPASGETSAPASGETSAPAYGAPTYGATTKAPGAQPTTSAAVGSGNNSGDNGFNTPIETPTGYLQQPTTTAELVGATSTPCSEGQMTQAPTGGRGGNGRGGHGRGGNGMSGVPTTMVTLTGSPQPSASAGTGGTGGTNGTDGTNGAEGVIGNSEVPESPASTTAAGGNSGSYGGGYRRARRARH